MKETATEMIVRVVRQFGKPKAFSLRNFASGLSELCGFACLSRLTAKYAKDFAKDAKQTDPLPLVRMNDSPVV